MEITKEQVRVMSAIRGFEIPEGEIEQVAARMSLWLTAFEQVEAELGAEMDETDPIPPVLAHAEVP